MQSDKKALVNWAKRKKIFKKEGSELSEFFKRELSVKMGDDYHFEVSWLGLEKRGAGEFIREEPFGIFIMC